MPQNSTAQTAHEINQNLDTIDFSDLKEGMKIIEVNTVLGDPQIYTYVVDEIGEGEVEDIRDYGDGEASFKRTDGSVANQMFGSFGGEKYITVYRDKMNGNDEINYYREEDVKEVMV